MIDRMSADRMTAEMSATLSEYMREKCQIECYPECLSICRARMLGRDTRQFVSKMSDRMHTAFLGRTMSEKLSPYSYCTC